MKKFLCKVLTYSLVLSTLASCSSTGEPSNTSEGTTLATKSSSQSQSQARLQIITSTFAEYCWVQEILGEQRESVEVKLLLDGGMDMHSYAPSVDDIVTIGSADLFLHMGGESFGWVDSVLDNASNDDLLVLNMMESLGDRVLMEQQVGIVSEDDCCDHEEDHDHGDECEDEDCDHDHDHADECEDEDCDHDHDHAEECEDEDCDHDHDHAEECEDEDCDHDHDHTEECEDEDCDHDHDHAEECEDEDCDHDHDHAEECEDEDCDHDHDHTEECEEHGEDCDHDHSHEDEHLWMSLKNAQDLCTMIAGALQEIDPDYKDEYQGNLEAYLKKLQTLDKAYGDMIATAERDTFVVADRFPYLYLVEDYGLNYYAAFSGCSAETEASFETIIFLAGQVDAYDLPFVVTTETGNDIAKTVISSTSSKDQEILVLNSIQSTTSRDGVTYYDLMEENLAVLTEVLNG